MSAKGYKSDGDDEPKTFELIEVIPKGEDIEKYEPIGILYRDPRVDEDGGFDAERGKIVNFKSTAEGDTIILMTNLATVAEITRKGPQEYVADEEHEVYCYPKKISCSKKPPNGTRRNRRRRGRGGRGSNSNHA